MCLSATVIVLMVFTETFCGILDEHVDSAFQPSTVNFNEIFSNSFSLPEEPTLTTSTKDEDFHLNLPSQFVEFRPQKQETTTTPTPPPPMYLLNSSYLKKDNETSEEPPSNQTISTTKMTPLTEMPKNTSMYVIPLADKKYQRGVLDLLFPSSRVKTFKGVFDTFRKILSYTFRRR